MPKAGVSEIAERAPTGTGAQRAEGRGEVVFGASGVQRLYQKGCIKLRFPRPTGPLGEVIALNSSGGVTGGDRLSLRVRVTEGAGLCVTTPAAERIYRSTGGPARINNRLFVGAGGRLDWLPQETILFDGANLERGLEVDMAKDARLLAAETLIFGRAAMGEVLATLRLRDSWRIRRAGRLIRAEGLRLDIGAGGLAGDIMTAAAGLDGARAVLTIVYVAPDAVARLSRVRALLAPEGVRGAASAWNGMLLVRLAAPDARLLRAVTCDLLTWLRGGAMPRVWML